MKKKESQQQTDQRSIFSMKGTIIVSLSWQKKVFDFDLKKMPKTETSNITCIAKKTQSKTVRRFLSEYL